MEMHQVRYFLALSETLNFTRAAERCNVAQPSLTAAIKKLETELGGPLFRRERQRSHLTDLGRIVKPHLERIHASSEVAREEATAFWDRDKAPLRLGVMCTIGPDRTVDLFARLRSEIPSLDVELKEAPGSALVEHLMDGDLDIALIGRPEYPDRLDAKSLYTEKYVVAFPQGHRFEALSEVPLKELELENYLARVNCEHPRFLDSLNISANFVANAKFRSEREDWVQAMIAAGMGVAVVPEFMPSNSGIGTRLLVEPEVSRTISLVTVSGRRFSPTIKTLVRLARYFEPHGG
jgi:LysR family hydrogen peroxide-inducible transcriptional activator